MLKYVIVENYRKNVGDNIFVVKLFKKQNKLTFLYLEHEIF
jgi:hypothetical protein